MGQLWTRAVGAYEDNNQSPVAAAIRDNDIQEVHVESCPLSEYTHFLFDLRH